MTEKAVPKPTLPYGWVVKQSHSYPDRVYYFNVNTGASTWEKPVFKEEKVNSTKPAEVTQRPSQTTKQDVKKQKSVKFCPSTRSPSIEAKFSPEPDFDSISTPIESEHSLDLNYPLGPETTGSVNYGNSQSLSDKVDPQTRTFPLNKGVAQSDANWSHQKVTASRPVVHPSSITQQGITPSRVPANYHPPAVARPAVPSTDTPLEAVNQSKSFINKTRIVQSKSSAETKLNQVKKEVVTEVSEKQSRKRTTDLVEADVTVKKSKPNDEEQVNKGRKKWRKKKKKTGGDQRKVISRPSPVDSSLCKDDSQDSPENPLISDPEKMRSIQVWINQCEPDDSNLDSISDILDRESTGTSPSPDSGNLSLNDSDCRRVIISGEKFPQKTVDSGISSVSNVTHTIKSEWRTEFPHKTPNLSWKGVHSQHATVDTSRADSVPMEIDEVQQVLSSHDNREVENMDVSDIALKEVREQIKKCPKKVMGMLTESICGKETEPSYTDCQKGLSIVLDTNVLISDLGFVEDLRDHVFDEYGRPILVIPWVVMQELDALKGNKSPSVNLSFATASKARASVSFLYTCFQQHHPRVIGQTPNKASEAEENFKAECNDDRVLQCCQQCQKNNADAHVVLLSNDKNLINKAVILGITAYTRWGLLSGLKVQKSAGDKDCITRKVNSDTPNNSITETKLKDKVMSPPGPSKSDSESTITDEMLCKFKMWLKESLSVVLEREMKKAYDDIWLDIVLRKPPWSLRDVLECFRKHWIAVFGYIYRRSLYNTVDKLCNRFKPSQKDTSSVANLSELLGDAVELLEEIDKHQNNEVQVVDALQGMKKLQRLCDDLKNGAVLNKSLDSYLQEKSKVVQRQATPDVGPTSSISSDIQQAERRLTRIWEIVFSSCNTLQTFLDTHEKERNQEHLSQVLMMFRMLVPAVKDIRYHYSYSLTFSPEEILRQPANVHNLCVQANGFFVKMEIQDADDPVTVAQLQALFGKEDKRGLLKQALDQLDSMIIKLHEMLRMLPDS